MRFGQWFDRLTMSGVGRHGVSRGRLWFGLGLTMAFSGLLLACGGASQADLAPDFPMTMYTGAEAVGGEEIKLSDLQGKPIALNFWAGLCPPCRAEMPDMQEFYDEYHEDILLVGVDVGPYAGLGNSEDAVALLESLSIKYPTGSTPQETVMQDYKVLSMPTTVFITSGGEIFRKWSGPLNKEKLAEITREMLAVGPS